MKKLDVHFTRNINDSFLIGTLADDDGRIYFEYAPEFLRLNLNLSPFRLPPQEELFEHVDKNFGPLPGLFDDSLPDGWGLLLMDRHFQRSGVEMVSISPLYRLAWLGTRTMGALTYHPPASREKSNEDIFDLHVLAGRSQDILAGRAVEVLPQLLRAGGSPGGARPKVLVGVRGSKLISGEDNLPPEFEHWIVKFFAKEDPKDLGAMEYAYSLMAKAAGINISETRIFRSSKGERFFGTKRFDRDGDRRYHIHTFGNLIQVNFRRPSCDYADLLKTTSILTRDQKDVVQLFRRMVFNVFAHNRDDHVKNFAFIFDDITGEWSLAPAYDLIYTAGPGGEHSMTLAGEGRNPGVSHILELAKGASISQKDAKKIIDEVSSTVHKWPKFAGQAEVGKKSTDAIFRSLGLIK